MAGLSSMLSDEIKKSVNIMDLPSVAIITHCTELLHFE